MPQRKIPIANGEVYHSFNRTVAKVPVFHSKKNMFRALETINFYIYKDVGIRFSHFNRLSEVLKREFRHSLRQKPKLVEIYAYCLMPNHFHFLLKQNEDNGIITFLRNFQNSYAKYFNTKYERNGALFQTQFKSLRIEDEYQFIHVARYIHLNPLTSHIIKTKDELKNYDASSFKDYFNSTLSKITQTSKLFSHFKSLEKLEAFTLNQIDYQQKLHSIRHLKLE